ncbi:MAG TPA: LysR family transcriptional regulator [Dongiaceae bacterium]|jgi:DNA-binding transcriptional LysR family regulator|nr:LysR family transcriptional regulator [Dongiaceae bacterium]
MNLHDLNLFATVARLGSITKAAKALATVQSNVTARIRLLEDELGAQLLHRHHHGISLTRKGQEFLPYAQQMTALVQKARETVSNTHEVEGVLRLGSLQTTAAARLPELLRTYVNTWQRVDLAIETGTTRELVEAVLNHRLDGAFVCGPIDHHELDTVLAFEEELVLVTPLAYRSPAQYLSGGAIPKLFVFKIGCSYRSKIEQYLARHGVDLLNEMEFGTIEGIVGCVSAGLGITMLPRSVVERSARRHEVRLHELAQKDSRVETLFVTPRSVVRSSAMERFIEVIAARTGMAKKPKNSPLRRRVNH